VPNWQTHDAVRAGDSSPRLGTPPYCWGRADALASVQTQDQMFDVTEAWRGEAVGKGWA
jgi:hypothetical protein